MKKLFAAAAGAVLSLGLVSAADASTRAGLLRCHVHRGVGLIIGSSHHARCLFTSVSGHREHYAGSVKRLGLDVGYTNGAVITWSVYAPSMLHGHALAGDYFGASADISAGSGGGANVLVGGNAGTISLQPLSLKTEKGVALGAGAGALILR